MKLNPLLIIANFPYISEVLLAQQIFITPEMAEEMLTHNVNNYRSPKEHRVEFYVKEILEGRWEETAATISFDKKGTLNNGQHRLLAIIRSGKGILTLVAIGVPSSARKVEDRNLQRSNSLILQNELHFKNASRLAAAANSIRGLLSKNRDTIQVPELYARWIRPYEPLIHEVVAFKASTAKMLCGFITGPVALAFQSFSAAKRDQVQEQLFQGIGLLTGNPLLAVRNYALRDNASTRKGMATTFDRDQDRERAVKVLNALAQFDRGEKSDKLFASEGTTFEHFGLVLSDSQPVRVRRTTGAYAEV